MEASVTTVGQPAEAATTLAMATPRTIPDPPPSSEMSDASMMNWLRISRRRAPTARRTPISLVRSRTEASMMFMMPIPPTSNEMPAMQPITRLNIRWVRRLCSSSASGHHQLPVGSPRVQAVQQRPHGRRGQAGRRSRPEAHHDLVQGRAVGLPLQLALHGRHRRQDLVGRIAQRHALEGDAAPHLAGQHPHDLEPEVVDLDAPADRRRRPEEVAPYRGAEHADLGELALVPRIQEPPLGQLHLLQRRLAVGHPPDPGLALAVGCQHLVRLDGHPRHHRLDPGDRLGDGLGIAQGHAGTPLADLGQLLVLRLLRPHQDVADAQPVDHRHGLPLGPCPDGQHGDHGAHAEDHPQHRKDRPQTVAFEVPAGLLQRLSPGHSAPPITGAGVGRRRGPDRGLLRVHRGDHVAGLQPAG